MEGGQRKDGAPRVVSYYYLKYPSCERRLYNNAQVFMRLYLVASFSHHLFPPSLPDCRHCDHPLKVGYTELVTSFLQVLDEELVLQVFQNLGNDVDQVEVFAVQSLHFHLSAHLLKIHGQKFVCSEGHPLSWSIRTSRLVSTTLHTHCTAKHNYRTAQHNYILCFLVIRVETHSFCCNLFPCWKNQEIRTERCITRKGQFPT